MSIVQPTAVPAGSLLADAICVGGYADCFVACVPGSVTLSAFVQAFYTTPLFKCERWILGWAVARPSTDLGAAALAAGESNAFAAWTVDKRGADELLLRDFTGRTRSWLQATASVDGDATELRFGSAIEPQIDRRTGQVRLGRSVRLLLGFHTRYSVALLGAAVNRLGRS